MSIYDLCGKKKTIFTGDHGGLLFMQKILAEQSSKMFTTECSIYFIKSREYAYWFLYPVLISLEFNDLQNEILWFESPKIP